MSDALPIADAAARLRRVLADHAPRGLVSAYLFGSSAEGRSHRESDLDLGVLLDRGVYPHARDRFEAELDLHSRLSPGVIGQPLDVVVLNDASPLLGRHVVWTGQRIVCTDPARDHAFRRDVLLRAADLAPFIERMRRLTLASFSR